MSLLETSTEWAQCKDNIMSNKKIGLITEYMELIRRLNPYIKDKTLTDRFNYCCDLSEEELKRVIKFIKKSIKG